MLIYSLFSCLTVTGLLLYLTSTGSPLPPPPHQNTSIGIVLKTHILDLTLPGCSTAPSPFSSHLDPCYMSALSSHYLHSTGKGPSTTGPLHILFPLPQCFPSLFAPLIITLPPTYLLSVHHPDTSLSSPPPPAYEPPSLPYLHSYLSAVLWYSQSANHLHFTEGSSQCL